MVKRSYLACISGRWGKNLAHRGQAGYEGGYCAMVGCPVVRQLTS